MTEIVKTLADIVLQINEAVNTVQQNKKDCLRIVGCARIYCGLVESMVKKTDITQDEFLRHTLEDAKSTFQEALKVVEKCQERHIFCRFIWAKDIADELKNVLEDLKLKMHQANTCGVVYNAKNYYAATMAPAPPCPAPPPPPPPPPRGEVDIEVSPTYFARFNLSMLKHATDNFSEANRIGLGGFSSVYKGVLHDGREVAIKKFHFHPGSGEKMFFDEFIVGLKLQHKNVVSLLGYCNDRSAVVLEFRGRNICAECHERLLVLEYVPNGSLDEIVKGARHIDWSSCFKIFQEIAQGLRYIHKQRVIHLDLKPSNVLFDSDMAPVIIDFGLSKVLEQGEDKILVEDCFGTVGYIAPEHLSDQVVSFKSDVYGFGITLLRTIISLDAIKKHSPTDSQSRSWYSGQDWERALEKAGMKALAY